jgi:hypothetical protein
MSHLDDDRRHRATAEPTGAAVTSYIDTCSALVAAARRLVGITADRAVHAPEPPRPHALAELDRIGAQLAMVEARLHRLAAPRRP